MQRMKSDDHSPGIAPPGYRLPPGIRLGPVHLQVSELERSIRFYDQVLGLRVLGTGGDGQPDSGSGRTALLGVGEAEVAAPEGIPAAGLLVELSERPGAAPTPRHGRPGLYHFALLLPDRGALGSFASHLAALGVRPGASDHRVSEALYLWDPDGFGIEVYADRSREAWQVQGGQLVMATDPLDLADLASAGKGRGWAGMPPGAEMGHVHLHVGDLRAAETFYHEALGLDKVVWSYPGALFLSAGGYHHHLGVNTWANSRVPAHEGDARLLRWEILVPGAGEVERVRVSFEESGFVTEGEPEGFTVRDPWSSALRIRGAPPS